MSDVSHSQHDEALPGRPWQFSLRVVLILVFVLSLFFAIIFYLPRYSAFTVLMTLLMLFPLSVAAIIRAACARLGTPGTRWSRMHSKSQAGPVGRTVLRIFYDLGLWWPTGDIPVLAALTIAVTATGTLVVLWPVIREVGLTMALITLRPVGYTWDVAMRSMQEAFSRGSYWLRLWEWELWSASRWWFLFASVLGLWLLASSALPRWLKRDRVFQLVTRFLAFAPWMIVLEVAFLVGVWLSSPITVPEPSTGFVVGIFSWDLWRWDCWLDRGWLIRGALPTFVAGCAFFTQVLRWRWPAAVIAAVILVPIALALSVACTVAYQHGLPPLY